MTDNLFKPSDTLAKQKLETSLSIRERLAKMKSNLKHTLLLDLSGSMYDYCADGKSKRTALEEIVKKLPAGLRKFAFSGECVQIEGNEFPSMGGSTRLAEAFIEIKRNSINEIILITDGEPDNPVTALRDAKGLKIEIIYIGPEPRPKFLEDLAKICNGGFVTVDMLQQGSTLELENKIKGLLGG